MILFQRQYSELLFTIRREMWNMTKILIWHNLTDIQRTHILLIEEKSGQKESFLTQKFKYASGPYTNYFFWDANRRKEAAKLYRCRQLITLRVSSPSITPPKALSSSWDHSEQYSEFEDIRTAWLKSTCRHGHILWREKVYTIVDAWQLHHAEDLLPCLVLKPPRQPSRNVHLIFDTFTIQCHY